MDDDECTGCSTVVKVQLLGDRGVGKTSLMMSFINDQFFDITSPDVFSSLHTTTYKGKVQPMFNLKSIDESNSLLYFDEPDLYRPMTDEIDMYTCGLETMSEDGYFLSQTRNNTNQHSCSYVDDVYIPGAATTTGIPCIIRDQPLLLGEFEQTTRRDNTQIPAHVLDCPASEMAMRDLVLDADVLCLVYRTDETRMNAQTDQSICERYSDSGENILNKWIPFLQQCFIGSGQEACDESSEAAGWKANRCERSMNSEDKNGKSESVCNQPLIEKPVIIVGNIFDPVLISECNSLILNDLDDRTDCPPNDLPMSSLMTAYPWIRYWLRCSALTMHNVAEVFYCAQKSVIYPPVPIYHPTLFHFRPAGLHAIQHMFAILDVHQIGQVSDQSLMLLQQEILRSYCRMGVDSGKGSGDIIPPQMTHLTAPFPSKSFKWDILLPTARDFVTIRRMLTALKDGADTRELTSSTSTRIDHRVGHE